MAEINEEILAEVRELKHWLYGQNGFEGDIPGIKKQCEILGLADKDQLKKIHRIELILVGSAILGGGGVGIAKLLGV